MKEESLKTFSVTDKFIGYRNKTDVTQEDRGVSVAGSQNCIIIDGRKIGIRPGFEYVGGRSTDRYGIQGGGSWKNSSGDQIMWRSYYDESKSKVVMEIYYENEWEILEDNLINGNSASLRETTFWDNTENIDKLIFVNGNSWIYSWSGAIAKISGYSSDTGIIVSVNSVPTAAGTGYSVGDILTISTGGIGGTVKVVSIGSSGEVTAIELIDRGKNYTGGTGKTTTGGTGSNCTVQITEVGNYSLTIEGSETWGEKRFLSVDDSDDFGRSLRIKDDSGVWHNTQYADSLEKTTLVGLSFDPALYSFSGGNLCFQRIDFNQKPSSTSKNDFCITYLNQLFVFSLTNRNVLGSKLNDFNDFTAESSPRLPGESITFNLDEEPTSAAVAPTGSSLYITTKNYYYQFTLVDSSDLTKQTYKIEPTYIPYGGASNPLAIGNIKNYITMVTGEPTFDTLGNVLNTEGIRSTSLSDQIKNYMDSSEVDEASNSYYKNNCYLSIKSSSDFGSNNNLLIRNLQNSYWETPWTIPSLKTFEHNGELYGHDPSLKNTYKLFTGYSDGKNGNVEGAPISAKHYSPHDDFGLPFNQKEFDTIWVDGYITPNTELDFYLTYDFGSFTQKFTLKGSDTASGVVLQTSGGGLGYYSLGTRSLGGRGESLNTTGLRRFRGFITVPRRSFYELQWSCQSNQVNARWELCAFAPNVTKLTSENNNLKFN